MPSPAACGQRAALLLLHGAAGTHGWGSVSCWGNVALGIVMLGHSHWGNVALGQCHVGSVLHGSPCAMGDGLLAKALPSTERFGSRLCGWGCPRHGPMPHVPLSAVEER